MRVGVLMVTYRSAGHAGRCLESLNPWLPLFSEGVLVVDNASDDETCCEVKQFPNVRLVTNAANAGFAAAVNQGFRLLGGAEAILLLNPDVRITARLDMLIAAAEEYPSRVLAGLLTNEEGIPQIGFTVRRFPTAAVLAMETLGLNKVLPGNPVNRKYRALDLRLEEEQEVEQPAGAFLLIPRGAWVACQGFDERFWPAWFEDVDFLLRARRAGWRAHLLPQARAIHAGGHSFAKVSWSRRQHDWYGNLLRYAAIHFGPVGRRMVACSVLIGSVPRAVTGMFRQRSLEPLRVYSKVFGLAASQMLRAHNRCPGPSTRSAPVGERPWLGGS